MNHTFRFALILILLSGCKKEPPPAPSAEATPPTPAAAAPAAAAPAEPAIDLATLPVEEDFEDDAEKEVTAANLTQKLDELEKEIGSE